MTHVSFRARKLKWRRTARFPSFYEVSPPQQSDAVRQANTQQSSRGKCCENGRERRQRNQRGFFQYGENRTVRQARIGSPVRQDQSIFFKLPLEIRQLVYQKLFGSSTIHIVDTTTEIDSVDHRIGHYECDGKPFWPSFQAWNEGRHYHGKAGHEGSTILRGYGRRTRLIALCLACRLL